MNYSPLHWLAYWNDFKSIEYLLGLFITNEETQLQMKHIISFNYQNETPVDVAGIMESKQSLQVFLNFFKNNFKLIKEKVFNVKAEFRANDLNAQQLLLLKVKANDLTNIQKAYCTLYYWAAYAENKELVNKFLVELGVSPYIKMFNEQNVISAAIKSKNFDIL